MSKWKGRTRGGYLGYAFFVFLISHFPLSFSYFILRFVVVYFLFFSPKAFRAIRGFYRHGLNFSPLRSLVYVVKNYYSLGQCIIDKLACLSGRKNYFGFELIGENHLRFMAESGKGGILISAHVGNWDIAGALLEGIGAKVNIVMFDDEHKRIKKYLQRVLDKPSFRVIAVKDDLSHILAISTALRNGELVCLHGDRYVGDSRTVEVDFFGSKARFPLGPFVIASKFGVPVSYVFAMKESSKQYTFYATAPENFTVSGNKKGSYESDAEIVKASSEYAARLMETVVRYPSQWFNYYDFWR